MRRPCGIKWLLSAGLVVLASLHTSAVWARTEAETGYSKAQTFSTALRYLRVDLGYEVTEKDPDVAYVLFRFVPSGQRESVGGSVEVVETEKAVKVLVQITKLPAYYEAVLRDGLLGKLREEYGEPVNRARDKEKDKDKSGDKDKDEAPKDKGQEKPAENPESDA